MLSAGRDAVICDLAETYGILDMDARPARLIAVLAAGLHPESRIMALLRQRFGGKQSEIEAFDSAQEFEAARAAILRR